MLNRRNTERRMGQRRQVETMAELESRLYDDRRSVEDRRAKVEVTGVKLAWARWGFHLSIIGSVFCYIVFITLLWGK